MTLSSWIVYAGLAASLVAGAASADRLRIAVGDLGQHEGAVAFDQRVGDAANKFCFSRYRPQELSAIAACKTAIREEAMDQLTPAQRDALNQALHGGASLASAGR